jgi:hypothetical protein
MLKLTLKLICASFLIFSLSAACPLPSEILTYLEHKGEAAIGDKIGTDFEVAKILGNGEVRGFTYNVSPDSIFDPLSLSGSYHAEYPKGLCAYTIHKEEKDTIIIGEK